MKASEAPLTGDIIKYSIIAFPISFAGMPLYVHAPDFYSTRFGVSLTQLGAILLLLRLFDAIQDPFIGYLSDRIARYRIYLIGTAGVALAGGFYGLFTTPVTGYELLWFATFMLIATTAFSILGINLNALGGLWSRDRIQKTRIASFREAFSVAGLMLAVILPGVLVNFMNASEAFALLSMILGIAMAMSLTAFTVWYRSSKINPVTDRSGRLPVLGIHTWLPAVTKRFFLAYFVSMLASAIPAVLVLFFIRDRLQSEVYTGLFLLLYFGSGITGMTVWNYLGRRIGKYNTWIAGMGLAAVSFVWALFLGPDDILQYAVICVISGLAFGSDLVMPSSILADQIQDMKQDENANVLFGILAFLAKAALALATVIAFTLLDGAGYRPGADNTETALYVLSIIYAGIPCVIKLFSISLLWRGQGEQETGDLNEENICNGSRHSVDSCGSNSNVQT